jgi:hypothetical protein
MWGPNAQVFPDATALAEAICAAAYECPADCDWALLARMLEHASSALQSDERPSGRGAQPADADEEGWEDWDDAGGDSGQSQPTVAARVQEVCIVSVPCTIPVFTCNCHNLQEADV